MSYTTHILTPNNVLPTPPRLESDIKPEPPLVAIKPVKQKEDDIGTGNNISHYADADWRKIRLIVSNQNVKRSGKTIPGQLPLMVFVDLENPSNTEVRLMDGSHVFGDSEEIYGQMSFDMGSDTDGTGGDMGLPFGKDKLPPKKEKKSKPLGGRSKNKDNKFEVVYARFQKACMNNGFDCPSFSQSNRQIDLMIQAYGVERMSEIAEFAVNNWDKIDKIISNFRHKPIPTLSEIALGFVCEHLNAQLSEKKPEPGSKKEKELKQKEEFKRLMMSVSNE